MAFGEGIRRLFGGGKGRTPLSAPPQPEQGGFMTAEEMEACGFLGEGGLHLGWAEGVRRVRWISDEGHFCCVGATGTGKSQGHALPMLLDHEGPAVVIAVKREMWELPSRERAARGRVAVVDPFGMTPEALPTDCLNPFRVPAGSTPAEHFDLVAYEIVSGQGAKRDFWALAAANLISTALNLVHARDGEATPHALVEFLSRPDKAVLDELLAANVDPASIVGEAADGIEAGRADLVARRAGKATAGANSKTTFACIVLEAAQYCSFLDLPQVTRATGFTSFNVAETVVGDAGTVFLCIDENRLKTHGVLARLWLTGLMAEVSASARAKGRPSRGVLFLVDETGNVGSMGILPTAVTLYRSNGVRVASFWQSFGQMKALYGDLGDVFVENAAMLSFLGTNSLEDAERIARYVGGGATAHGMRTLDEGKAVLIPFRKKAMLVGKAAAWRDHAARLGPEESVWIEWAEENLARHVEMSALLDGGGRKPDGWRSLSGVPARLLPPPETLGPATDGLGAQQRVFRAMAEGAPSGTVAIYDSVRARVSPGDPFSRQGDIVVVDPRRGVLVVEVKGGKPSWNPETGGWEVTTVSGSRTEACKDPYAQVEAFARDLVAYLRSRGIGYVPVRCLVAFPDVERLTPAPAAALGMTLCAADCAPERIWTAIGRLWDHASLRFVGSHPATVEALWGEGVVAGAEPPGTRTETFLLPHSPHRHRRVSEAAVAAMVAVAGAAQRRGAPRWAEERLLDWNPDLWRWIAAMTREDAEFVKPAIGGFRDALAFVRGDWRAVRVRLDRIAARPEAVRADLESVAEDTLGKLIDRGELAAILRVYERIRARADALAAGPESAQGDATHTCRAA